MPIDAFSGHDSLTKTRLSGVVGSSWRAWSRGTNAITVYGDYRNSYKPLAVDFGPEAEVRVLKPETASSYEIGAKIQLLDGNLDIDTSIFRMDFKNGLAFGDDGSGNVGPINGGQTRFQGSELDARYALTAKLQITAHYAHHDARFVRLMMDNGAERFASSCNVLQSEPIDADAQQAQIAILKANYVSAVTN